MKKTRVYYFGNALVPQDAGVYALVPKLQYSLPHIDFIQADPNENFPPCGERDVMIMDTVLSISHPLLITIDDLAVIKKTPISPHDYDLLFHLLLLKKLKKIDSVRIIAIPPSDIKAGEVEKLILI